MATERIVVVGAGQAGWRAVEAMRGAGFKARAQVAHWRLADSAVKLKDLIPDKAARSLAA